MTDCAIESENESEREITQLMIFFDLKEVIFSYTNRHKIFSEKQHSYLRESEQLEKAKQQIRPRENIPNLREKPSAFV